MEKVMRVFFSTAAPPENPQYGDIWVKSDIEPASVVFQIPEPAAPQVNTFWIKPSYPWLVPADTTPVGIYQKPIPGLAEVNCNGSVVQAYTAFNLWTYLGLVRRWTGEKWQFVPAAWWDGTSWVAHSYADYYVYSGSADKTVRKLTPDGQLVWSYTGHTNYVNAVAVDPGVYGAFPHMW